MLKNRREMTRVQLVCPGAKGLRRQDTVFQILFGFSNTGFGRWALWLLFQNPKIAETQPGKYYLERDSKNHSHFWKEDVKPWGRITKAQPFTGCHGSSRTPPLLASFTILNDQADPRIERRC